MFKITKIFIYEGSNSEFQYLKRLYISEELISIFKEIMSISKDIISISKEIISLSTDLISISTDLSKEIISIS